MILIIILSKSTLNKAYTMNIKQRQSIFIAPNIAVILFIVRQIELNVLYYQVIIQKIYWLFFN